MQRGCRRPRTKVRECREAVLLPANLRFDDGPRSNFHWVFSCVTVSSIHFCIITVLEEVQMTIWLATGNAHKKNELEAILTGAGIIKPGSSGIRIPSDAGLDFAPDETGSDFCENALIKARELYFRLTLDTEAWNEGDVVISDDSGICLDALGGRPGIFSARYAGTATGYAGEGVEESTSNTMKLKDSERNLLLLDELGDSPLRTACFVCAMVLLYHPGRFFITQETFEGEIVKGPECIRGTGGFGYDPIFFVPELGRTAA